jgi:antitoxin component YwqK of YwqJK toxin-antitoxin module
VALMEFANGAGETAVPDSGAEEVREIHAGGGLRVSGWMVGGRRHGHWREWHESGSLASDVRYVDGLKEGVALSCYRDGFPKAVRWFRGDVEHGVRLIWYRDGRHWQEVYVDGVRHGPWREYVDGMLRVEGRYEVGVKRGQWRRWDAAGRPIR